MKEGVAAWTKRNLALMGNSPFLAGKRKRGEKLLQPRKE